MRTSPGMRCALAVLLALHGAIHVLGFLKPWKLAAVPQLSGRALIELSEPAARAVGLGWLACTLLLLVAAALRVDDVQSWWLFAAAGIFFSQALIVLQWQDAKAGTALNVILLLPVLIAGATARFDRVVAAEVQALLATASGSPRLLSASDVASLPPPVRRWLDASGVIGRERARVVRVRQRGQMRLGVDSAWMPTEATQFFAIDAPAFIWRADVTMLGLFPIVARDRYADGFGRMTITAGGLIPIVDATGPKIDQGALLRYLGEMIWFPSGAVSPFIQWEPIDDQRARATMTYEGASVSADFEIDPQGRFTRMTGQRYFGTTGTLERWVVPATAWKSIRGVEMAVRGSVLWKLASGDFEYFRWEILDVEQNHA